VEKMMMRKLKVQPSIILTTLFLLFGFNQARAQFAGGDGTQSNPWQIATIDQLNSVRDYLDDNFELIADLNFTGSLYDSITNYNGWEPIGTFSSPFTGNFNGKGHTISGLYINRPNSIEKVGLFSDLKNNAKIDSLILENCNITGNKYVGGLTGVLVNSTISNCSVTGKVKGEDQYIGGLLGGGAASTLSNCVTNVTTAGRYSVGGLGGSIDNEMIITDCHAIGNTSGMATTGGLVGYCFPKRPETEKNFISNCYATGNVSATQRGIGGLIGQCDNTTVINCYATGSVVQEESLVMGDVGGLIGNINNAEVSSCYATGNVTGGDYSGGLIGNNEGNSTFVSCYYNSETCGCSRSIGNDINNQTITGLTTAQMKQESSFQGFDFSSVWTINNGITFPRFQNIHNNPIIIDLSTVFKGNSLKTDTIEIVQMDTGIDSIYFVDYPQGMNVNNNIISWTPDSLGTYWMTVCAKDTHGNITKYKQKLTVVSFKGSGTDNDPYQIWNVEQLDSVRYFVDKYFILMTDLDLSENSNWNPIGASNGISNDEFNGSSFTGSFNGNGHVISNLYINRSADYIGLFVRLLFATVENLSVFNVDITGNTVVGGIAGAMENSEINNCTISGKITGKTDDVGGITGKSINGSTVKTCISAVNVSGTNNIGGLIGYSSQSVIDESHVTGNVTGNNTLGGLIGNSFQSTIDKSYVTGDVTGNNTLGGLCGYISESSVSNCYARGNVAGEDRLGGLSGANSNSDISNCYATGSVLGDEYTAGLSGYNESTEIKICYASGYVIGDTCVGGLVAYNSSSVISSFYNKETSGQSRGIGQDDKNQTVKGLTTAEMKQQNSFPGFDFTTVWSMANGQTFPRLQNIHDFPVILDFVSNVFTINKLFTDTLTTVPMDYDIDSVYIVDYPQGMTINDLVINWTPDSVGTYYMTICAKDIHGALTKYKQILRVVPFEGAGTKENPFQITNLFELDYIKGFLLKKDYILMNDLDFSGSAWSSENSAAGWEPITPFTGNFNGNGHTINNLYINSESSDNVGLFGRMSNATIDSLSISNIDITGNNNVGGLTGYSTNSEINNCNTSGNVNGVYSTGGLCGKIGNSTVVSNCYSSVNASGGYSKYDRGCGGLVGEVDSSTISSCYATGDVTGGYNLGGLAGISSGPITNCHATGDVSASEDTGGGLVGVANGAVNNCYATGNVTGKHRVGGLIGRSDTTLITNCHARGDVTGTGTVPYQPNAGGATGGLIGYAEGTVSDCYAAGNVTGRYAGGVVGYLYTWQEDTLSNRSVMKYCYAAAGQTVGAYPAGVLGNHSYSVINDCYFNSEINEQGDDRYATGLTTAEMKQPSSFSGFDFSTVWTITNNKTFPCLKNVYDPPIILGLKSSSFRLNTVNTDTILTIPMDYDIDSIFIEDYPEGMILADSIISWSPDSGGIYYITIGAIDKSGGVSRYNQTLRAFPFNGSGTATDPFQIWNIEELNHVRDYLDKYFILMDDLDFSGSAWCSDSSATGWEPITTFSGNFNGNGHVISNLYINSESSGNSGLFGRLSDAAIDSLSISNIDITGKDYIGGIAGYSTNSEINNCTTSGYLTGKGENIGGLCGKIQNNTGISNCYSSATTNGGSYTGGLVGYNDSGSTVSNCYAVGSVSGDAPAGGLVGYNNSAITNSYYNIETSEQNKGIGQDDNSQTVTALTTAQMKQQSAFSGFDFSTVWSITNNKTFPCLKNVYDSPIILASKSSSYKLNTIYTDTIKAVPMDHAIDSFFIEDYPGGMILTDSVISWTPDSVGTYYMTVGVADTPGVVSKYKHTLIPFRGSGTAADPFQIWNIEELNHVRNYLDKYFILMDDLDFSGSAWCSDSSATGWAPITTFSGNFNGKGHVISNLYINSESAGLGLFGRLSNAAIDSLSISNIDITGKDYIGGITGYSTNSEINNCTTSGYLTGKGENIGGLCGKIQNSTGISNCYSSVYTYGGSYIGGLVGYNDSESTVSNCYAVGVVSGDAPAGGLVGYNNSVIVNSYFNNETSGQNKGIGQDSKNQTVTALTTAEMKQQSAFSGFDFSTVWTITNSKTFPCLKNVYDSPIILGLKSSSFRLNTVNTDTILTIPMDYDIDSIFIEDYPEGMILTDSVISWTPVSGGIYYMTIGVTDTHGVASKYKQKLLVAPFRGSGTAADPYQIWNLEELNHVRDYLDKYFILMDDLDFSGSAWCSDSSATGWEPVTTFSGNFNGKGHVISNLYVNSESSGSSGLFGSLSDAAIDSLSLSNMNITGNGYVGGIAGYSTNSEINNCTTSGYLTGKGENIGGLCGRIENSTVVANCYSSAHTYGGSYTGGLVGYNDSGSTVSNCYAVGEVIGNAPAGGLVGYNNSVIVNSYFNYETSGQNKGIGQDSKNQTVTALTTAEMKQQSAFSGFDFSTVWTITNSKTFPCLQNVYDSPIILAMESSLLKIDSLYTDTIKAVPMDHAIDSFFIEDYPEGMLITDSVISWTPVSGGTYYMTIGVADIHGVASKYKQKLLVAPFRGSGTAADPFQIWNLEELNHVRNYLDKYFILMDDLDFSGSAWCSDSSATGWEPITTFSGNFNGNGHVIRNLYISRELSDNVGLFGSLSNAAIDSLSLSNMNITGNGYVGGIAGYSTNSDIYNCTTSGYLTGNGENIGGLCGRIEFTVVSNCHSSATTNGGNNTGGLVGYSYSNSSDYSVINNSSATGSVSGHDYVGGLVGRYDVSNRPITISNCYASGDVTGNLYVGGLVGYLYYSKVNNCYASGDVTGDSYVGGLLGYNMTYYETTNCYSSGSVTGNTVVGGFIGYNDSRSSQQSVVLECFYNRETSGQEGIGEDVGTAGTYLYGLTTEQMKQQSYFTNESWDFVCETTNGTKQIWAMNDTVNNGAPFLSWQGYPYDEEPPVITSTYNDTTIFAGADCEVQLSDYTQNLTYTENCDLNVDILQTPAPGTLLSEAVNKIYIIITDGSGNSDSTFFNILINDAIAPVPDVNPLPDIFSACSLIKLDAPTATDNCAGTVSGTHDAILPIITPGTTAVTWTYDDGKGNTSAQTQNVIIGIEADDNSSPIPNSDTLANVSAECEVNELTTPTATDNCVGLLFGTHDATLPITTQGTTIVTWTYDDGNGNTSSQTQNVVIEDVTAPVPDLAALSDVTAECEVSSLIAPTATDNCAGTVNGTHDASLPITAQGTTVVTWTYDDGNGNTSAQIQNVVINDVTVPVPDNASLDDITAECEVSSLIALTATDNCAGTVTGTHNVTLPITAQGTTVVTWTYDDGKGNTSTQTQNVVIKDVTAPVPDAAALADVTAECEVTSLTAPTATDNCAGTVTGTHNVTLPITAQGTTTVTWTYDDGNGNTSTQTQNVVIKDVTAPVPDAAALADVTAECEVTSLTAPTATDNCAGTVTGTHNVTLPITTQGTTIVTWTYDDGNGNTSTQTQNVVIEDVTAPVPDVAALADVTAECEITSLTAPTATDNCAGTVTGTHNVTLPIIAQGTTVVTWTYDDGNGNTSSQTQNVVINDVTAPVPDNASLDDITAECEVSSLIAPTATDNCAGTVTGTHNVTLPIIAQGTTVVTWTYDDDSGNTSSQTQNVVINDVTVPVPDNASLDDITAECQVNSLTSPTATDNCAGTVNGTHDASLPITAQGTTVVTWTYDDGNGNTSSQTQNVVINDVTAPVPDAAALADVTAECEVTSLTAPTATDNCSGTVTGTHNVTLPITAQGITVVTWTYDDGNGNTSTQTQNVVIEDVTAPVPDAAALADVTAECEVTSLTAPTATDNCAGTVTGTHDTSLPITAQGTTVVTWTYDDGNGNTSSQTQNVVINDVTVPVPDNASLDDITAECQVNSLTSPTATDNCAGIVNGTHNVTLPITAQGTTVVIWTYDDSSGNTSAQTQNVLIEDVTVPVPDAAALADVTAECEVTRLTAPTATDNCAGTVTGTHNVTLPITAQGTTVVTWTYNDGNGNTSAQTQNVVIEDVTAPVPDAAALADVTAECEVTSLTAPTATDNCAGLVFGKHDATLPITTQGTTLVTWTYDDGNGNTSTQTQNVVIEDVTAPVPDAEALADVTAECEVTSLTAPTATDNCAGTVTGTHNVTLPITAQGTTTVTWTYDDGNGNTSTQTQNVVIEDVTAPVPDAAALADVTAECEVTSLTAPTATDNCAGTVTGTHNVTLPITAQGITVVTWTYDDGNGNISTQTQNVVIEDITVPVPDAAALADVTAECEVSSLTAPTATDNCAGTVTGTHNVTLPITAQGTTVVTWTYDDGNGNTSTQTQNVVIEDVTAPVPDAAALADVTAECEVSSLTAPTATDNCAGTVTGTHDTSLPITAQGTTVVTWTYDDGNGNTSSQTQNVVINDVTVPVPDNASLDDITAECQVNSLTSPTATDNCAGTVTGTHNVTLPITAQGTTLVTWTYDDGNGNTSTQTQNVVIAEDDISPEITCVENVSFNLKSGEEFYLVEGDELDLVFDDNCTIAGIENDFNYSATLEGAQVSVGDTIITWTATDLAGNISTCSFTLSIEYLVGVDDLLLGEMKIYPNPAKDIVYIESDRISIETVSVVDMNGKIVIVDNSPHEIDVSKLVTGTYLLRVEIEDKVVVSKLLKK
jgi:hypothetical protein